MPSVNTSIRDFPSANMWGVSDGVSEVELGFLRLVHAAMTVGHGYGWRKTIETSLDGQMELLWKLSAFVSTVRCISIQRWRGPIERMVQTGRFERMDPSERRALNYHLGMTMACAWGRKVLGVPWFLHLDLYRDRHNANIAPGRSRPDLIGRHPDGWWVVMECKGYSSKPQRNYRDPVKDPINKAREQARRVIDIGGAAPDLRLATFSYFARAAGARRNEPKTVTMMVWDPPGEDDEEEPSIQEPIKLPEWTPENFFRSYYEPWFSLLDSRAGSKQREKDFTWQNFDDIGVEIGLDPLVYELLAGPIKSDHVAEILSDRNWPEGFVSGGDGIFLRLDERWKRLFTAPERKSTS